MLWVEKAGSAELYFQTIEMVWCLCSHNLRKVNQPTFFKNAEMLWLLAGYWDAFFWMRAYTGRWKNDENCIYLSVLTVLTLRYPWKEISMKTLSAFKYLYTLFLILTWYELYPMTRGNNESNCVVPFHTYVVLTLVLACGGL